MQFQRIVDGCGRVLFVLSSGFYNVFLHLKDLVVVFSSDLAKEYSEKNDAFFLCSYVRQVIGTFGL